MGCFLVTVDDGTGNPPSSLLATVTTAIEAVRPVGSSYMVQAVTVTPATIAMTVTVVPGAVHGTVAALVVAAVTGYVDALPIGAPLPWSRLAQIAYQASPQVANVTAVLLNGGTADLAPPRSGVVKAATVTVN